LISQKTKNPEPKQACAKVHVISKAGLCAANKNEQKFQHK